MNNSKEFDNILDECLERLLVKGETLEQCLTSFPQQAEELKPLLEVALATKKAVAIQPRAEFREQARQQLYAAMPAQLKKSRSFFVWRWQSSWVTATAIILAILLMGSGTVFAAGGSMPDQPLYPVKLATEQVKLTFSRSALDKAGLYAEMADKRVQEMTRMAGKNKPEKIERAARRMDNYLENIAELASTPVALADVATMTAPSPPVPSPTPAPTPVPVPSPVPAPSTVEDELPRLKSPEYEKETDDKPDHRARLKAAIAQYARNNPEHLRDLLKTAPPSVRPALRRALDLSESGYEKALRSFD